MRTLTILVITLYCQVIAADKYVKLYNLVCDFEPEMIENASCNLKVVGRNVVVANMDMDLKYAFKNWSVHFQFFKFYSQFRPFLIDVHFNVCDILSKKSNTNFFINLIIRIALKYSNAIMCPLQVSSETNASIYSLTLLVSI